jgi:hypothetical protein
MPTPLRIHVADCLLVRDSVTAILQVGLADVHTSHHVIGPLVNEHSCNLMPADHPFLQIDSVRYSDRGCTEGRRLQQRRA